MSGVTDMVMMFRSASSFNQDLSDWCVSNIGSKPFWFDVSANTNWINQAHLQPQWGTCPFVFDIPESDIKVRISDRLNITIDEEDFVVGPNWVYGNPVKFANLPARINFTNVANPESLYVFRNGEFCTSDRCQNLVRGADYVSFDTTGWSNYSMMEGPIEISTCQQLQDMNNCLDCDYVLVNDIDCSDTINWNDDAGFLPVGYYNEVWEEFPFTGSLDGQGFIISDLFMNWVEEDGVFIGGLFGYTDGAVISNVGLKDVNLTLKSSEWGSLGGFGGQNLNTSLSNVFVTGYLESSIVGGLSADYEGDIINSYTNVTLGVNDPYSWGHFGGLLGYSNTVDIINSYTVMSYNCITLCEESVINPIFENGNLDEVFFDCEVYGSGCETTEGKTTAEMQDIATFSAWDIAEYDVHDDETWKIHTGFTYPMFGFEFYEFIPIGCTDPTADNYDEEAEIDDGSCHWNSHFYELNGTIYCPTAQPGWSGEVGGVTFTAVDNSMIHDMAKTDDFTVICTSHVTNMDYMFYWTNFNQPIGSWDTSKVTTMVSMFDYASNFNQDISGWNTSSVTNMYRMFTNSPFNQPIGIWDTSSVTDMGSMFLGASSFNQDISNWCVTNIGSKPNNFDSDSGFEGQDHFQPQWGTCPFVFENPNMRVRISDRLNITIDEEDFVVGSNWVYGNPVKFADIPARINFTNVDTPSSYGVGYNGEVCDEVRCENIVFGTNYISFDVSGWSNYSYGVLGCMDSEANNYNEDATIDDGSCEYLVYGCTDEDAFNFDPEADTDDGSCLYYPYVTSVGTFPEIISPQNTLYGTCVIIDDEPTITYHYSWYRNGTLISSGSENVTSGEELTNNYGDVLSVGDEFIFSCYGENSVRVSDEVVNSSVRTILPNQLPVVFPTIDTPAFDANDLDVFCRATDTNLDDVMFDWRVYKNGLVHSNGVTDFYPQNTKVTVTTIPNEDLIEDDEIIVSCRAYDGFDETDWYNSTTVTILRDERPPVISYVRLFPIIVFDDSSITSRARATDPNLNDVLDYSHRLVVNDVVVETKVTSANQGVETETTFDYSSLSVGDEVKINVSVTDGEFTVTGVSDTFVVRDVNNPPVAEARFLPNIVGEETNVRGYCKGTDADGDYVILNLQFFVNDNLIGSNTFGNTGYYGLSSGSERSILLNSNNYNVGDTIRFVCTASDTVDSHQHNITTVVVEEFNYPPTVPFVQLQPSTGTTLTNFDINVTIRDVDSDDLQVQWRIRRNGQTISTQTSDWFSLGEDIEKNIILSTLPSSETKAGDNFRVEVRAYDGVVYSSWISSNLLTIQNTPPIMLSSHLISDFYENQTIFSECTASDVDIEQDLTFTKRWYRNGELITTANTLSNLLTSAGEEWVVGCRAFDGYDYSEWLNSTPFIIIPTFTEPYVDSISLSGNSTHIIGECSVMDIEGKDIDYTFEFTRNGVLQTTINRNDEPTGENQVVAYETSVNSGDNWSFYCEGISPDGVAFDTAELTIPTIDLSVSLTSSTQTSLRYDWVTNANEVSIYKDDVFVLSTNLNNYELTGLSPETYYNISFIPVKNNFIGDKVTIESRTRNLTNNPPVMVSTRISPETAFSNNVLSGYCKATDIDSVRVRYLYEWSVNDNVVQAGISALQWQGEEVLVNSLASHNFVAFENVSFSCIAYDTISYSSELVDSLIIDNKEQEITEVFVVFDDEQQIFTCNYEFFDLDGDLEISNSFRWFINDNYFSDDIELSLNDVSTGDKLSCEVTSNTDYHSVVENSSSYFVGDFEPPVISDVNIPIRAFIDSAEKISAVCVDNIGVATGYPRIRFINPNLLEEEYPIFYDSGNSFSRFITFSIPGVYTNIEIICSDGNQNLAVYTHNETITSRARDPNPPSGGGDPTQPEPEITYFDLSVFVDNVMLSLGQTRIIEFEVMNVVERDLKFTMAIMVDEDNPETYNWMSFEGGVKALEFDIIRRGSLSSGTKFVRYFINVPNDVEPGEYFGTIEISTETQTEQYRVRIVVTESGVTLLSLLNYELFKLPFTETPTGAVIGGVSETEMFGVKVWMMLLTFGVVGVGSYGYRRMRK